MKTFNKLVRDNIPEIIQTNGDTPHFHIIENDDEYLKALLDKDVEESKELAQTPNLEELVDKLEVIRAIAKALGYTPEQLEQARAEKAATRGGFDKRIFLESTD
jgi:predicted house-cleaning noncanonical NTP pyrophosphatase (MazG superfamily)